MTYPRALRVLAAAILCVSAFLLRTPPVLFGLGLLLAALGVLMTHRYRLAKNKPWRDLVTPVLMAMLMVQSAVLHDALKMILALCICFLCETLVVHADVIEETSVP